MNQGEKETFCLGGMTITKGQNEEFAFEQVDLTLIQARALHNWNVKIGPCEKVVHVDRDLRVVYVKEIFFLIVERHNCEGQFRQMRRQNYRTTEQEKEENPEKKTYTG